MRTRNWAFGLAAFAVLILIPAGCIFLRNFSHDPVKWTFVRGAGSFDAGSRKWSVYLSRGETKSATIRLDNTSSKDIEVLVVLDGPDYIPLHLESPSIVEGDNGVGVRAGSSAEITVSATANPIYSSAKPRVYVIDMGWSTDEPRPGENEFGPRSPVP